MARPDRNTATANGRPTRLTITDAQLVQILRKILQDIRAINRLLDASNKKAALKQNPAA